MPWFKTRTVGDDDVVFSVKRRIWWTLWLFSRYEDYSTARAVVNKLDTEIIELLDKVEAKLSSRMILAEACEAEYKEAVESKYDIFGVSKPRYIDDKTFNERVKPHVKRPDEKRIISSLSQSLMRKYQFNKKFGTDKGSGGRNAGDHRPYTSGVGASTLAIVPEAYRNLGTHLRNGITDVDSIVFAKEDDKKGNQPQGKKAQMGLLRQEIPFDKNSFSDHKEWNEHLESVWQDRYGSKDH